MVRVKSEADSKKNYEDSTVLVPARFEAGVKGAIWQSPASEGQALYESQMMRTEILARRKKGIEKVSDESWRRETIDKGKGIIGTRMKNASDKQVTGFRPYRDVLTAIDLPAKTADPMANLMNRAGKIVQALVDKKKELTT